MCRSIVVFPLQRDVINHHTALLTAIACTDERQYKVLNDKTLRRMARKAARDLIDLGCELDLDVATDIETITRQHRDNPTDQAFYILKVRCMNVTSKLQGGVTIFCHVFSIFFTNR